MSYTDDDVAMVAGEFCHDEVSAPCRTCLSLARQALDDVAPAIAGRALREAADQIEADRKDHWFSAFDAATRLRARAEQVTSDE